MNPAFEKIASVALGAVLLLSGLSAILVRRIDKDEHRR